MGLTWGYFTPYKWNYVHTPTDNWVFWGPTRCQWSRRRVCLLMVDEINPRSVGGFKCFLISPRSLGKWYNLTNIFQVGWFNHHLEPLVWNNSLPETSSEFTPANSWVGLRLKFLFWGRLGLFSGCKLAVSFREGSEPRPHQGVVVIF